MIISAVSLIVRWRKEYPCFEENKLGLNTFVTAKVIQCKICGSTIT